MKFQGVITGLDKYKQYTTEHIKGKDGVTRPITKVYYTKPCTCCGLAMNLDDFRKGQSVKTPLGWITKGRIVRWKCPDCNHSEREETKREENIREGHI